MRGVCAVLPAAGEATQESDLMIEIDMHVWSPGGETERACYQELYPRPRDRPRVGARSRGLIS